jgi:hypothetical protein
MNVFKFRVVLDVEEDVFRDIEIPTDYTFENFYEAIINAFEFKGGVMSSFYISNNNWDKGEEITLLDMSENGNGKTMSKCVLNDYVEEENQKLILVYDFMRMWCFYIELVEELIAPKNATFPKISMKFGDAPAEESRELTDFDFAGLDTNSDEDISDYTEDMESEIGDMFDDLSEYDDNNRDDY